MRDLFIVGAGGFGREAVWTVERINKASHLFAPIQLSSDGLLRNAIRRCTSAG